MNVRNTSRLRIALIPPLWARVAPSTMGGVEFIVHLLADELVKRGHDVTVFTSSDSPTAARVVPLCECNLIEAMERGRAWEYEYYETCNIAEALQRSDSFDVVHFHVGCYAIPLGALSRSPVLHTLHNPITPDTIWLLERYAEAPVTAVSHSQIAGIPDQRRCRIRVIHNGCDFEAQEFSPAPGKYLAYLGRMGPGKAPHDAIRIAKDSKLPLVLAGQPLNKEDRAYFAERIQPSIDGHNVIHIGAVDHRQKSSFLRDAAALLFPIQAEEAFGMVMIEAMACGTPVIALRRSSVEEVVDAGKTGFYADSVEELALLVGRALALDRNLVWEHARQRFSHLRMVDEYLETYQALVHGSGNGRAAFVSGSAL
ncbi:MAG: glycosyltransferase family 4 protein [Acidobacteria bacterium]|nr:MAG: glycosyltransferase family 4 protein [Acidobacteriota bacterium]